MAMVQEAQMPAPLEILYGESLFEAAPDGAGDEKEVTVVLLAEDDPELAELYCAGLGRSGFLVIIAEDGRKAVHLAEELKPAIICLDIRMPELDGLGVLTELRAGNGTRALPVVMLTNHSEPELLRRARQLGALDYLIKSDTPPTRLAQRIRKALEATAQA